MTKQSNLQMQALSGAGYRAARARRDNCAGCAYVAVSERSDARCALLRNARVSLGGICPRHVERVRLGRGAK